MKTKEIIKKAKKQLNNYREFLLDEIDAWESGKKATIGCPFTCQRYINEMNIHRSELLQKLKTFDIACGKKLPDSAYTGIKITEIK